MPILPVFRRLGWLPNVLLAATLLGAAPPPSSAVELFAGGFSFSDELGGFRLISVSGTGSASDPIVLVEEITEVAPITLVIRRHNSERALSNHAHLTLVKAVVNSSNRVWGAFEVELQEVLSQPSVYSDGLSFKQFAAKSADVASDSFAENNRRFEPYDRILFQNGFVDPEATARFKVTITDPTPVQEFYLVQDPKLLSS